MTDKRTMVGRISAAVRSHRAELVGFLARRLRCFATAEDLTQEAYVRLFQAGADIRSPRAFLFQVAANLAKDHHRVHGRRDDLLREAHEILWVEEDEITPERHAVGRELMERLDAIVAELPDTSRRVFQLGYYEGLTQNEIADRLRVSRTTVKKHLSRVFNRLADVQGEFMDGDKAETPSDRTSGLMPVSDEPLPESSS